jgi:hypothetical protein
MFKEVNEMRKKTSSLLYVLNTTTDCKNYSGDDKWDTYDDVNTYLLKYGHTQYCVTDYTDKWNVN